MLFFNGASNVQLSDDLLKICYQKLTVMCGVYHKVSLLFKYIENFQL